MAMVRTRRILTPSRGTLWRLTFKCRSPPTGTLPLAGSDSHVAAGRTGQRMPHGTLSDENRVIWWRTSKTFPPRWQSRRRRTRSRFRRSTVTMKASPTGQLFQKWSAGSATDNKGAGMTSCVHINRHQDQPILVQLADAGNDALSSAERK